MSDSVCFPNPLAAADTQSKNASNAALILTSPDMKPGLAAVGSATVAVLSQSSGIAAIFFPRAGVTWYTKMLLLFVAVLSSCLAPCPSLAGPEVLGLEPNSDVTVAVNSQENVTFECAVDAGSSLLWQINFVQLLCNSPTDRFITSHAQNGIFIADTLDCNNSTLTVTPLWFSNPNNSMTAIKCIAFDVAQATFSSEPPGNDFNLVIAFGRPDTPRNLRLEPFGGNLFLVWEQSDVQPVTTISYTVTINSTEANGENFGPFNVGSNTSLPLNFIFLAEEALGNSMCNMIEFFVVAENEAGCSDAAVVDDTVPISPDVTNISSSLSVGPIRHLPGNRVSFTVSFLSVSSCSNNFPVLNYTVAVAGLEGRVHLTVPPTAAGTVLLAVELNSTVFPGFVQDALYSVSVSACSVVICRQSNPVPVYIDECVLATDNCHGNATCTDTEGSFNCTCNPGFEGDGVNCTNIDECALGTDNCHMYATCTDTEGSFNCTCNPGFEGDGVNCTGKLVTPGTDYSVTIPAVIVPILLFIGIIFLAVVLTLCRQYMRRRRGGTRDTELSPSNRSACSEYTYHPVSAEKVSLQLLEDHGEELTAASDTASPKVHTQIFVLSRNHSSMELHNPLLKRVIVRSHSMDAIVQAVARINALDQAGIPYIFSDQYLERDEANGEQSTQCRWLHGNLQQVPRPENIDQYFMLPHYGDTQPAGAVRITANHSGPSEHVQFCTRLHYQYKPYDHSQSPPYIGLDLFSGEQENITNPRHPYDAIELYERNNHPYSPRVDPVQYRGRRHSL